jgi:hypothetical protein
MPSWDLFVYAKDLFVEANGGFSAASFLADQQEKHSGSYQQRNQNTDGKRQSPVPTLDGLRPSAFLRCSDA